MRKFRFDSSRDTAAATTVAIDVQAELRDNYGRVVRRAAARDRRFVIELSLTDLAPGPYVVHVAATSAEQASRTASRDVPIRVSVPTR